MMTFVEMTNIIDNLRCRVFLPFLNETRQLWPPLIPCEVTRLNKIGLTISQYNRAPAFDGRCHYPFISVAGPNEVYAAEFLVAIGTGENIRCGWPETSGAAMDDARFFSGFQQRFLEIPGMEVLGRLCKIKGLDQIE